MHSFLIGVMQEPVLGIIRCDVYLNEGRQFHRSWEEELPWLAQLRLLFVVVNERGEETHLAYIRWLVDDPQPSDKTMLLRRMSWETLSSQPGGKRISRHSVVNIDNIIGPACMQQIQQLPDTYFYNEFV